MIDVELVHDGQALLAEGPVWDPARDVLWWVDIPAGRVHRLDPATGHDESFDVGEEVGAVILRRDDGLLLATASGLTTCDARGAHAQVIHHVDTDPPGGRFNDAKADRWGRVWAGTLRPKTTGAAALYRLDADGSLHTIITGVSVSNGLDWSPDGHTMYYVDTPTMGVDAFDYQPDTGAATNRRRLIDVDGGNPDGLTVDVEGGIWVALFGGGAVVRYTADGRLDRTVNVPATQVTSCGFGGRDLSTLFITTARRWLSDADLVAQPHAGAIFAVEPGVLGQQPGEWWG